MKLTLRAAMDIGLFIILAILGITLGNVVFLYLSLIPLFYLIISFTFGKPSGISIRRDQGTAMALVDQNFRTTLDAEATTGVGLISIADKLPEHFELMDGNNFHVFWKGPGPLKAGFSYEVRCTKRGLYEIGPAGVESQHHSWLEQVELREAGEKASLVVKLRALSVKKMRDPRLLSKMPTPIGALSKQGMNTSDFLEIRSYSPGDAFRTINWKATARLSAAGQTDPLVNEYEKEGKKTVYIFVDSGAWMGLGSNVDNVFEYALQAASGISSFYLERDMKVGIYVYHSGENILPDTGRKQEFVIKQGLLGVDISVADEPNGLKKAVYECQGHLLGTNPLFIIITMATQENAKDLIEGVKSMRWFSMNAKTPQVVVVHITGYEMAATGEYEKAAAGILDMGALPHMKAIRRAGAFVVPWNPKRQSLNQLMVVGFRRR
jgi:uncharacterized protein (DUF58 family)